MKLHWIDPLDANKPAACHSIYVFIPFALHEIYIFVSCVVMKTKNKTHLRFICSIE